MKRTLRTAPPLTGAITTKPAKKTNTKDSKPPSVVQLPNGNLLLDSGAIVKPGGLQVGYLPTTSGNGAEPALEGANGASKASVPALLHGVGEMELVKKTIKLDIGCGAHPQPGFVGIDIQNFDNPNIIRWNITKYPWPVPSNSVSIAIASHVAEHINPHDFGFVRWLNEIWRVMVPGGQLMMAMPYGVGPGYVQDPTHCNPCNEHTWRYFDPLDPSGFYKFYRPAPWKYDQDKCAWDQNAFMEVVLEKRLIDKSYDCAPGDLGGVYAYEN